MEQAGFEVRDVESLREHYARTLRAWVANLEASWDEAVRLAGVARARVWRLYMAGSCRRLRRRRHRHPPGARRRAERERRERDAPDQSAVGIHQIGLMHRIHLM